MTGSHEVRGSIPLGSIFHFKYLDNLPSLLTPSWTTDGPIGDNENIFRGRYRFRSSFKNVSPTISPDLKRRKVFVSLNT